MTEVKSIPKFGNWENKSNFTAAFEKKARGKNPNRNKKNEQEMERGVDSSVSVNDASSLEDAKYTQFFYKTVKQGEVKSSDTDSPSEKNLKSSHLGSAIASLESDEESTERGSDAGEDSESEEESFTFPQKNDVLVLKGIERIHHEPDSPVRNKNHVVIPSMQEANNNGTSFTAIFEKKTKELREQKLGKTMNKPKKEANELLHPTIPTARPIQTSKPNDGFNEPSNLSGDTKQPAVLDVEPVPSLSLGPNPRPVSKLGPAPSLSPDQNFSPVLKVKPAPSLSPLPNLSPVPDLAPDHSPAFVSEAAHESTPVPSVDSSGAMKLHENPRFGNASPQVFDSEPQVKAGFHRQDLGKTIQTKPSGNSKASPATVPKPKERTKRVLSRKKSKRSKPPKNSSADGASKQSHCVIS